LLRLAGYVPEQTLRAYEYDLNGVWFLLFFRKQLVLSQFGGYREGFSQYSKKEWALRNMVVSWVKGNYSGTLWSASRFSAVA